MGKLTGILNESLGGMYTIRGYAIYDELIRLSTPHHDYQRSPDEIHIEEIKRFLKNGLNSFSPEIVLAYTLRYDFSKNSVKNPVTNPLMDIIDGLGFKSNIDNIRLKVSRKSESGSIVEITTPNKSFEESEKPFRRVDGNHRLRAIEELVQEGHLFGKYIIPFCLILLPDEGNSLKQEKVIFHNINSKAKVLTSEQLLKGIIDINRNELDFSDDELKRDFGYEYRLVRNIITKKNMMNKLAQMPWFVNNEKSFLICLIRYISRSISEPLDQEEHEELLTECINDVLNHYLIDNGNFIEATPGLFMAFMRLCYSKTIATNSKDKDIISKKLDMFRDWVIKYGIAQLEAKYIETSAITADNILAVFDKYFEAKFYQIFLSRWFDNRCDETNRAIERVINKINLEKCMKLSLFRVDRHDEGVTADIFQRILKGIAESGLVIADFTGGRPNVHHEIGITMGMDAVGGKKGLILVHHGTSAEADAHIPANIKMYEQVRFHNNDYGYFEKELEKKISDYYGVP